MGYLLIVSMVWAFSFGLIKSFLGDLDPNFVACARIVISFLIFLPILRLKKLKPIVAIQLFLIGMIQFGLMYVAYLYSFRYLAAYQVVIYTTFTPIYVTCISDLLDRRFHPRLLLTSSMAIVGTYIIVHKEMHRFEIQTGFLLLQVSNLCFAAGQVFYRRLMNRHRDLKDAHVFGLLYFGAFLVTIVPVAVTTSWPDLSLDGNQVLALLYLGILASGICFFLWNLGARRTNTGALAIFNNLKIPLAVTCSLLVFGEEAKMVTLLLGGTIIIAALFINEYFVRLPAPKSKAKEKCKQN